MSEREIKYDDYVTVVQAGGFAGLLGKVVAIDLTDEHQTYLVFFGHDSGIRAKDWPLCMQWFAAKSLELA